jgi:hypothetical protein
VRILFAAHQFFPEHYAGVETVTLSLAQEFKVRGHEPYVLAPKRSIPGNDIEPGEVEDYEFGGIAWITRTRSWRVGPASTCGR